MTPDKCREAFDVAIKALRVLHRNGISDDIAGQALNDIQDIMNTRAQPAVSVGDCSDISVVDKLVWMADQTDNCEEFNLLYKAANIIRNPATPDRAVLEEVLEALEWMRDNANPHTKSSAMSLNAITKLTALLGKEV